MKENARIVIVTTGLLIVGFIIGFIFAQTQDINELANECNRQCLEYMDEHCVMKMEYTGEITPVLQGDDDNG